MVSVADVAFGQAAPTNPSFRNKIIGLVTLQRVALVMIGLPLVAGAMALAGGRFDDPRLPFALAAVWLISAAGNVTHDIVDTERDKQKWPLRPLPSGLISRFTATLYAAIMAGVGLAMAALIFNWLFAVIALLVFTLAYVYVRYTRDKIGYFTLVWVPGFVPVAAWAAISPATILTPLPWLLYTLCAVTEVAIDIVAESFYPAVKAFFVRPKPSTERKLYIIAVIAMFFVGTMIFFYARLPWPYMFVLSAIAVFALIPAKQLGEQRSPEKLKKAFRIITTCPTIYWVSVVALVWI